MEREPYPKVGERNGGYKTGSRVIYYGLELEVVGPVFCYVFRDLGAFVLLSRDLGGFLLWFWFWEFIRVAWAMKLRLQWNIRVLDLVENSSFGVHLHAIFFVFWLRPFFVSNDFLVRSCFSAASCWFSALVFPTSGLAATGGGGLERNWDLPSSGLRSQSLLGLDAT